MTAISMASPLYILRDRCQEDLRGVLTRLKGLGFDGVEFLGLFGHSFQEVAAWLQELDLRPLGDHVPLAKLEAEPGLLEAYANLGCRYLTVADVPMEELLGQERRLFDRLDRLVERARALGLRLQYHNHAQELLRKRDGVEALEILMAGMAPKGLCLEIDLGWLEIGGGDCEAYLRRYRDNCPVIHLKDYFATDLARLGDVNDFLPQRGGPERGCFEFRPTGFGVLNLPKLLPLCLDCRPEWFVMDHDLSYERDPYQDLAWSLDYVRRLLACCGR